MTKYTIEQSVYLPLEDCKGNLAIVLKESGYRLIAISGTEVSFVVDSDSSDIVSRGYFFNKADKGVVVFYIAAELTVLRLTYGISLEGPLILAFAISLIGFLEPSVFLLLIGVALVHLARLLIIRKSMFAILERCFTRPF